MRFSYIIFNRRNITFSKKLFLYDNDKLYPVTSVKDYLCNGHQYYLVETDNKNNGGQKTHLVKKSKSEISSK